MQHAGAQRVRTVMRIYYLSASTVPSKAANSIHVMKMCSALGSAGNSVTLFCRGSESENVYASYGVKENFDIEWINPRMGRSFGNVIYSVGLWKKLRTMRRPDLFYGRNALALWLVRGWGVPLTYEVHAVPETHHRAVLESSLILSRYFHRLVPISEALAREYMSRYSQLTEGNVCIAHDGADTFPEEWRNISLGRPRDKTLKVGYTGHLYKGKGVELIAAIAKKMSDVEFHVVGGTPELVAEWRSRASLENLIFHGFTDPCNVPAYLKSFDILLAPYQSVVSVHGNRGDVSKWMSPLKLFEYMASGKPIIASRLPVIEEVLSDHKTALLCRVDDVEEWCAAIRYLQSSLPLRKSLATNAMQHFTENFTWEKRAVRVVN